jgi:hypothetical protein
VTLTFSDRGRWHQYRLDDERVVSVTTYLNGGIPKPQLVPWAARTVAETCADLPSTVDELRRLGRDPLIAALTAVVDDRRNTAADRGTEIHRYGELVVHGEPVDVPAEIADAVAGYARWLDASGFEVELTERIVGNRVARYAGRFDLYGHMGGLRWLLDLKSGKGVYGDTALQCAAYARAEFYVDDDGVEHRMPTVDRIGVLHVQPEATELYDLGDIAASFSEFRAAQMIYAGATRRKNLVLAPVTKYTTLPDLPALFR